MNLVYALQDLLFNHYFQIFFFGNESKKKEAYAVTTKERKMLNS